MVANQAVEDYCFSKILMYVPDLKSDTDRLSDAIDLLRFEPSFVFEFLGGLQPNITECYLKFQIWVWFFLVFFWFFFRFSFGFFRFFHFGQFCLV